MTQILNLNVKNSFEAGLDLRFLNNRTGIDFTVYNETVNHQIGDIPVQSESGYGKMITNIGSITNKGIELSLRVVPVKMRGFEWESTVQLLAQHYNDLEPSQRGW